MIPRSQWLAMIDSRPDQAPGPGSFQRMVGGAGPVYREQAPCKLASKLRVNSKSASLRLHVNMERNQKGVCYQFFHWKPETERLVSAGGTQLDEGFCLVSPSRTKLQSLGTPQGLGKARKLAVDEGAV